MNTRIQGIVLVAAVVVASLASGSGRAGAGALAGSLSRHGWGTATEVPGTAALNRGGNAGLNSVSCAAAGNCSAGGSYTDSSGKTQAFVVSQANGAWGTAIEVPGTAALNRGGQAFVTSVSCGAAGNCGAGGEYLDRSGKTQVFVVSQVNGAWGTAIEVPGTAALNRGVDAALNSVSCGAAGNCSAGGFYTDSSGHSQAFVVSQAHGAWGTAIEVPGTAALNRGGNAEILSVSCASAGNCGAGGFYEDSSGGTQGVRGQPGPRLLAHRHRAARHRSSTGAGSPKSSRCRAARRATALRAGYTWTPPAPARRSWSARSTAPGAPPSRCPAVRPSTRAGVLASARCRAPRRATAARAGSTPDSSGKTQMFVVSQAHGSWGTAIEVPGSAALNRGGLAVPNSVSCGSAGNCGAGGQYTDSSGHRQALVVSQVNGAWGTAIEVPGTAALNRGGDAVVSSVSCAAAGNCSAGGFYTDSSGHSQAFADSKT